MTFKKKIVVRSSEDVRKQRAILNQELSVSQLSLETKDYLRGQIEIILAQFEKQLDVDTVKSLRAERSLDGEDFKIEIIVRGGQQGLREKIRGIFAPPS